MAEEKHIHIHPSDWAPAAAIPWRSVAESSRQYQLQHSSHDNSARPKETWPEVVGLTIEAAAKIVKEEKPEAEIQIVQPCYLFQQDLDYRRVRLVVDFEGKVHWTPTLTIVNMADELLPPTLPRTYGLPQGSATAVKTTWPEVVGLTAEEAEKKIKEDKPGAQIQVIPPDSFVTMDFRTGRVRIHVDSSGKVQKPPTIG